MLLLLPNADSVINSEEQLKLTDWALPVFYLDSSRNPGEKHLFVLCVGKKT